MKILIPMAAVILCGWLPATAALRTAPPTSDSIPLGRLLEAQQALLPYRIYAIADTALLVPRIAGATGVDGLRRALAGTPYRLSIVDERLFILPEREVVGELPATLLPGRPVTDHPVAPVSVVLESEERASSENKLYDIGDRRAERIPAKATLKGQVFNFKTGEPMVGVTVQLKDSPIATATDSKGGYTLSVPTGRQTIEITGINIRPTRRQLMLYGNGRFDIEIEEDSHQIREITVVAQRVENVKNTQLGMVMLRPRQLKNVPMVLGEVDLLRMVQSLPGVKTVGEASSGYNVRGGATDQNLILLNGGTIYNPNHMFGLFTAFNSDMVSTAELYKSSIPAQYGGRISSVLDIESREASTETFSGSAGIGLVTSNLSLDIPLAAKRSSLLLSGRTTYSDWLLGLLPEKSGYKNGKAGFWDGAAVLTQQIGRRNHLNVYAYMSRDRFSFRKDEKYNYENLNLSARLRSTFTSRWMGTFAAGYDHYDYANRQSPYPESAYKLAFGIDQYWANFDFLHEFAPGNRLRFGLKGLFYDVQPGRYMPWKSESLAIPDALQRERAVEAALYADDEWNLTPELAVSVGVRYALFRALGPRDCIRYAPGSLPGTDHIVDTIRVGSGKNVKTYAAPEFRISVRYAFSDHFSIKAGFNSMQQYIHKLSNSVIMSPTDTWKLSDRNIAPQKGWQAAAGLYLNSKRHVWEFSLEGYYKSMDDYLDYRSGARLLMNHHLETDVIATEGKAYGVELQIKKNGRLNGWISYTYARTFLRQSDRRIESPVNGGAWYPTEYDKPHDVKLVGNYKFTERFSFSLNMEYSTGRPTTIPAGKYWDEQLQSMIVYYTDRNSYRVADYFRADASFNIEPTHNLTRTFRSSISIGVYNLTGRKNVYSIYYLSEQGKIHGYRLSVFGAPIPFVSYNIKF